MENSRQLQPEELKDVANAIHQYVGKDKLYLLLCGSQPSNNASVDLQFITNIPQDDLISMLRHLADKIEKRQIIVPPNLN